MNRFGFAMILVLVIEPLSALAQVVQPTVAIDQINRTADHINRTAKELTSMGCQVYVNPPAIFEKPTDNLGLAVDIDIRNENSLSAELEKIFDKLKGFSYPLHLQMINFENPMTPLATEVDFGKLCDLRMESLEIRGMKLTSSQVKCIGRMKDLTNLRIENSPGFDDEGLRFLTRLKFLRLFDTNVSDAGLESISTLRYLEVDGGRVTGVGLSKLRELNSLILKSRALTNEGLAVIGSLSKLHQLTLTVSDHVDVSGLVQLKRLPMLLNLRFELSERTKSLGKEPRSPDSIPLLSALYISGAGPSETVCELLAGLSVARSTNLRLVVLNCPNLDDEVFRHLRECETSPRVSLGPCRVSEASFAEFKNSYRGELNRTGLGFPSTIRQRILSDEIKEELRRVERQIQELRMQGESSPGLMDERRMLLRGEMSGK